MRKGFLLFGLMVAAGCAAPEKPVAEVAVARARPVIAADPPGAGPLWPADAPPIHARNAILIDAQTGRTLYQKFADTRTQVASTQKLVTALVLLDRGNLDSRVIITREDTLVEPAKLYLRSGQSYTRRALLSAMMVKSENDAAAALARDHSGSIGAFASEMNRKARELGAMDSFFLNPHGLPAPQYSTARDMAAIAYRAYREPVLRGLMATKFLTFVYADGRTRSLENTNKLLGRSPGVNGMKTGYTFAAGRCLISSAASGGREVILVQFGSKTSYIFDDADLLMRWGLARGGLPLFVQR